MQAPRPPEREVDEPLGMRWPVGRYLAVVVALAMVLFWVAIFSGVFRKQNPDYLKDRTYASSLERRCTMLRADLEKLPNAADIETPAKRADVLDEANVLVGEFIDDLEGGRPATGDESIIVKGWIKDWQTYLDDREDYATRLREDPNAQLLLSRSKLGDSVDKTIEIFSQVNQIPNCATPGDVG